MSISRRQVLALTGAALATPLPVAGRAQASRKLTILVGFPAGGAPDTVARAISEGLRSQGYTTIVENKAGAGGRLATDALLAAPADGNTVVLLPGGSLTIYPHIYNKMRYASPKDFSPLATVCDFPFAFAVGPQVPAKTISEYVAWAKANPDKAQFATPGAGTAMHFLGVQFASQGKFELAHIPYKGGAPALTDVMGGNVPALFTTLPNLVKPHQAGRVRILAHSGANRVATLPDVPTFKEAGFPSLTLTEIFLVAAPSKVPADKQKELASALAAAAAQPNVKAALSAAEYSPLALPPDVLARKLDEEFQRWAKVVKATGYKSED
jgi:tripartite-type tricarboxylate transporter receptor subunit TctC